jgi:hypothetical protein
MTSNYPRNRFANYTDSVMAEWELRSYSAMTAAGNHKRM